MSFEQKNLSDLSQGTAQITDVTFDFQKLENNVGYSTEYLLAFKIFKVVSRSKLSVLDVGLLPRFGAL